MRHSYDGIHGELTTLPGCSQVVVSHNVFARTRGSGKGVAANVDRRKVALEAGYDYIMCTVDMSNEVQKHILEKNDWKFLDLFTSSKTGHVVGVYGRKL